ncbi:hypothetical protein [Tunturiibacter psychrotolerans]|uniref:hypothetical protein n=1 Tax=Tunturiibacter psychrotolerans TaxID=3069686 RepID=UPI003D25614E
MFALAKIAGHSSITITQKYVHPEADTIDEVFSRLGTTAETARKRVGTKLGTAKKPAVKLLGRGVAK